MAQYTEECKDIIYRYDYDEEKEELYNNEEDKPEKLEEVLEEVMKSFRNFDKSLDHFLIEHGYDGEIENIKDKIKYIQKKFDDALIEHIDQRILKNWFSKENIELFRIKREKLFRFCFAFQLSVEESNDFFRKVYLQRGFDCHVMKEAVYYYAISHNLNYPETKTLIDKLPKEDERKDKVDLDCNDILFTNTIIKEIDRFKNADELIQYFWDNYDSFKYNNVAAYKYIENIWKEISKVQGLADKEKSSGDDDFGKGTQKPRSVWNIYLDILGFSKSSELISGSDRSVSAFLKDNKLLHPLAADSFPGRQELEAILSGKHKSYEVVRKTLVMLLFYKFWVKKKLEYKDELKMAKYDDCNRYIVYTNNYLDNARYPMLYEGNPFDWIFMYAAYQSSPLDTFRDIISKIYEVKDDELRQKEC